MEFLVYLLLWGLAGYLAAGGLFALAFLSRGISKVDPDAANSGWGLRLLWLPGTIAFWPVLLMKWVRS